MTEYQIQPNTRRCAATNRELQPGERYFAVLREEDDRFVRQDFSVEAWQGPPAGVFSFWSGRVPTASQPARPRFDDELLFDCFTRLEGEASSQSLRLGFGSPFQPALRPLFARFEQGLAADEAAGLIPGAGEGKPRVDRIVVRSDVVRPVAIRLFDP